MKRVMQVSRTSKRSKVNASVNYKDPEETDLTKYRRIVWEVIPIRKTKKYRAGQTSVILVSQKVYNSESHFNEWAADPLKTGLFDTRRMCYVFDDFEKMTSHIIAVIQTNDLEGYPFEYVSLSFDINAWMEKDQTKTMDLLLTFAKNGLALAYKQGMKSAVFVFREPQAAYQILFDSWKKDKTWHGIPCLLEFYVDHIRDHPLLKKLVEEFVCEPSQ